jgi:tetratricopeptide (TPR) repeat protein
VADEVRATSRPGQGDQALKAFERAVALLGRGRDAQAASAAHEAKTLAPRSGAVREVLGMALYRAERFQESLRELQAYRRMTGRLDQNHLIADCYRALGSPQKAVEAAREVVHARVDEEVRAEAAIVGAAALADLGRTDEGLAMLRDFRASDRGGKGARPFDLRIWYVTADILDRAGRRREAADEFRKVMRHQSDAFDAAERLAGLQGS